MRSRAACDAVDTAHYGGGCLLNDALCFGVRQVGRRVTLVPYEREHVAKYHEWMKDPWLQGEWG